MQTLDNSDPGCAVYNIKHFRKNVIVLPPHLHVFISKMCKRSEPFDNTFYLMT